MSFEAKKTVILQRPLLEPDPVAIGELQVGLIRKVGKYMQLGYNTVRFTHPGMAAISIVGGNALLLARQTATPNSELNYLSPEAIAERLITSMPPSHQDKVSVPVREHVLVGNRPQRRSLGTQCNASVISDEYMAGQAALRSIGALPPPANLKPYHTLSWLQFRRDCPPELEKELIATANDHIPPASEFVFGKLIPVDLSTQPALYLQLKAEES